jgi:hypothetical protein
MSQPLKLKECIANYRQNGFEVGQSKLILNSLVLDLIPLILDFEILPIAIGNSFKL